MSDKNNYLKEAAGDSFEQFWADHFAGLDRQVDRGPREDTP